MVLYVPGRVELIGNHTDHQGGEVLAATINRGLYAAASRRSDSVIRVHSTGYEPMELCRGERHHSLRTTPGTAVSFLCGVTNEWSQAGLPGGGWNAVIDGDLPAGAGLSSSAAYGVLIATIFNHLYAGGTVGAVSLARIARQAECAYFGKPCGLMDQMVCACGGICHIDFSRPDDPVVTPCDFDFGGHEYRLAVIHTGESHADLIGDYASIAEEMSGVARMLGGSRLSDVAEDQLLQDVKRICAEAGDRAWLRAAHYYAENRRVREMLKAMQRGDMRSVVHGMRASGRSSAVNLQNLVVPGAVREQPLLVGMMMTEHMLGGDGACRVHGGGFAGTLLACVPAARREEYANVMGSRFGKESVMPLELTRSGAQRLV